MLLQMLRTYFYTGWYMVLDSSFCVLKALFELQKVEVYGAGLIKKRKYWPAGVPGDAMQQFFDQDEINVGECNTVQGVMDGTTYNLIPRIFGTHWGQCLLLPQVLHICKRHDCWMSNTANF